MKRSVSDGRRSLRGTWPFWGLAAIVCALLAIGHTWPLITSIDTGIPQGTEQVATVPLLNLWTLAWNVESLGRGYAGYWDAPIFHPVADTFALSEPQPLTGILAAILTAVTGSVLAAYNLILIGSLFLNGLLMTRLAGACGLGRLGSLAAGGLTVGLPFTHQELGVLQLVPLAGVLALALAVTRFAARPSVRSGLLLGLSLALAYGLCAQTAVFSALVLAPVALWGWRFHLRRWQTWGHLAAGAVLFLGLASPVLVAQTRAAASEGFERSLETVRKRSAQPAHYLRSPWPERIRLPGIATAERPSRRAFWPGSLVVLLAVAGGVFGLRRRALRPPVWGALLVAVTAFCLSLGPNLHLGDVSIVDGLRAIPGLSQIRSFFRFALFVQLAVVLLAAVAVESLARSLRQRGREIPGILAAGALAVLAGASSAPAMGPLQPLPPLELELPWLSWIDESTAPGDVFAFVPFPEGRTSRDYLGTAQWMYWQMRHWRPMVNGYSGFFPERFRSLKRSMRDFPSQESLVALKQAGVRYCVVHRAFLKGPPRESPGAAARLVARFTDTEHGLVVFELR